jgi:fructose-bisphosphate aldolase class I
MNELRDIAAALVADGKGILAADESIPTLNKRFTPRAIDSTPTSRRDYREMLLTTPGIAAFIAGVILHDETIRQTTAAGVSIVALCESLPVIPGIKVDRGAKPLAGHPNERVTEGLDDLRDRLAEYRRLGARFAKWRAVFVVNDRLPSRASMRSNAEALARYAMLCQEQGLVPIVEPEVLMDGRHAIERSEEVTGAVLHAVFAALDEQGAHLEEMLLKPNMVVSGMHCPRQASVDEVAAATLRCLRRHVPPAVPGIVFLSGGQRDLEATRHLDAINRAGGPKPWRLSFSYGRALQDAPLAAWAGKAENVQAAQRAFFDRARGNGLATRGAYSDRTAARVKETADVQAAT